MEIPGLNGFTPNIISTGIILTAIIVDRAWLKTTIKEQGIKLEKHCSEVKECLSDLYDKYHSNRELIRMTEIKLDAMHETLKEIVTK